MRGGADWRCRVLIKFGSLCDVDACIARSPEYTEWPRCRDCGNHVCPIHQHPGSAGGGDGELDTCLCVTCAEADAQLYGGAV